MAGEVLRKNICILRFDESNLLTKLSSQPCMSDGSARLWIWNAGCQATRHLLLFPHPLRTKLGQSLFGAEASPNTGDS
jgi:hypothetical protein